METVVDDGAAVLLGLVDVAVGETGAEAVRIVETVEIDLRLGMVMRRIGGPLAGTVQHLAQHHVGEGGVVIVEEGLDLPLHSAHQLALGTGVLGLDGLRGVHDRLVILLIQGILHIKLTVGMSRQGDLGSSGSQQAVGLVMEAVGAVGINGLAGVFIGDLALEKQDGNLAVGAFIGVGIAVLQYQQAHVHLGAHVIGGRINVGVVARLEFLVLVEIGHGEHLLFTKCAERERGIKAPYAPGYTSGP